MFFVSNRRTTDLYLLASIIKRNTSPAHQSRDSGFQRLGQTEGYPPKGL
ncbi:hypothetical protein I314_02286 [Cryptococcus bacillisporus CA1873]|uniref:Uncharacterized protein n=2 Tax=Cryptococcus gattii TaxID=552467 RepID=A0A0D0VXQ6_CRYGA|nr:hypothetical protein I312_00026 [Cryptococcus bacillisporus CA1280]KIR67073.1 hypothetical protein I314_02286 [Cryptococcus bacillisporus CA1873]|eukprot:KIR67073.1 hypothetical protein I314_02286 [Cryptococcus gattii CA1873]